MGEGAFLRGVKVLLLAEGDSPAVLPDGHWLRLKLPTNVDCYTSLR